jgi:hypothetical protein
MARTTVVQLIDDIDGSDADRSVDFSYKGKKYSLDLNQKNAADLDEVLAPYIAASEQAGGVRVTGAGAAARPGTRPGRARRVKADSGVDPQAVRAWAAANGITQSPRGRIRADVLEQYRAAGH